MIGQYALSSSFFLIHNANPSHHYSLLDDNINLMSTTLSVVGQMEKTVEINENSRFLEDLEMLSTVPGEQLPSSADETSPDNNSLDRLGSFKLGGSNPLEQLGLFMKADEDDEEPELPMFSSLGNDVEEGEID